MTLLLVWLHSRECTSDVRDENIKDPKNIINTWNYFYDYIFKLPVIELTYANARKDPEQSDHQHGVVYEPLPDPSRLLGRRPVLRGLRPAIAWAHLRKQVF